MLDVYRDIEEKLKTLTAFNQRVHHKPISTSKPSWEIRYSGAKRLAQGYRHRWEVLVWTSVYQDPRAQTRSRQRAEQIANALLELDCVLLMDIGAEILIPDDTDVRNVKKPLAHAVTSIMVEEAEIRG